MWSEAHVEVLEAAVRAHPGGNAGDFASFMRGRGVYLDRKTITNMLRELPQFFELGEGLHAWYLLTQLEPDRPVAPEAEMTDEEYRASLEAQWSRDVSTEEILKLINESKRLR